MPNVRESLEAMTQGLPYTAAHSNAAGPVARTSLQKFLQATMDEVRLFWADDYAQTILKLRDIDDASHFRHGVMRREVGGDVAYDKQRDHSAHTLNNYLLGWYVFDRVAPFQEEFRRHLLRRGNPSPSDSESSIARAFSNVWQWASLLHDVGYLFEGGLEALETGVQDERIRRGVEVARDYFEHRFWMEIRFGSLAERKRLLELTGVSIPSFKDTSIGAIADSLRMLPNLEKLQNVVRHNLHDRSDPIPEVLDLENGLPRDGFDLWSAHYQAYGSKSMVKRIEKLSNAFELLVWRGLPGVGIRVLDHAVCSGLLLLQYSTFYYLLHASLPEKRLGNEFDQRLCQRFHDRDGFNYKPAHWWTLHIWGTAAAAIHNLVQVSSEWGESYPSIPKLALSDDPVAWLGVLVDILEEWDRSPVRRGRFLRESGVPAEFLPIQGIDVNLDVVDGKLQVNYPNLRIARKVRADLRGALADWQSFVVILPAEPERDAQPQPS